MSGGPVVVEHVGKIDPGEPVLGCDPGAFCGSPLSPADEKQQG